MNKFLLVASLVHALSCQAQPKTDTALPPQTAYHVTGQLKENYRVPAISKALQRLLFVMENGNLFLPENGFYLHLADKDAATFKAKDILIVPLFEQANTDLFYGNYDKNLSFEIIPIPGVKDGYYTKNIEWFNAHNKTKARPIEKGYRETIFTSPSLKDTITWANFSTYEDQRDVPQWIEKLNSNEEVTVHHIGCAETNTGGYTIHSYENMKLSEFAKQRLGYVHNAMEALGAPESDTTQAAWRNWFTTLQSRMAPVLAANANLQDNSIIFKEEGQAGIAYDNAANNVVWLHPQTNYTNYKDQQVVTFNTETKTFDTYKIFNPQQLGAKGFRNFNSNNDTLTTLSAQFIWAKYVKPSGALGGNMYKEIAKKQLLQGIEPVKDFLNEDETWVIDQSLLKDELGFILYHKKDTREYKLLCFNSVTGEVIAKTSLRKTINFTGKWEYLPFYYDQENDNAFTILMKMGNEAHHLTFNFDLANIENINLGANFRWYPHYVNAKGKIAGTGKAFYYDTKDNQLIIYDFSTGSLKTIKIKMPDNIYDNELLMQERENYRLFYEYGDAFFHGIQSVLLDGQSFQPIGNPTVYHKAIQVENESSENTPGNLQVVNYGKGYIVSFNIDNEWHVITP